MGLKLNAPYSIAYRMGICEGKEHPDWNQQNIEKNAAMSAMALVSGGRANAAARRYFRELAHVYIVAAVQGQTGVLITEDEWCKQYNHPWEIYHIMQNRSISIRELQEARKNTQGRQSLNAKEVKPLLIEAVWNGEVDQINTRKVATMFDCSQNIALKLLKQIQSGQSGDARFVYDAERGGVSIKSGGIWSYSPMDADGNAMSMDGRPKHYIWFVS
jgi:hypothetical protein